MLFHRNEFFVNPFDPTGIHPDTPLAGNQIYHSRSLMLQYASDRRNKLSFISSQNYGSFFDGMKYKHSVSKVNSGNRYTLALWYTKDVTESLDNFCRRCCIVSIQTRAHKGSTWLRGQEAQINGAAQRKANDAALRKARCCPLPYRTSLSGLRRHHNSDSPGEACQWPG